MVQSVPFQATQAFAEQLDRQDELATFRSRFAIPKDETTGKEFIYFCGNSLGLMPLNVREYMEETMNDWANYAVDAHFKPKFAWINYHHFLRDVSGIVIGAKPEEIVLMNTLSVNIHLMLVSFYRPAGKRTKIIMEAGSFPSDRYAVVSQLEWHGLNPKEHLIEVRPREGEFTLRDEDILTAIRQAGDELALVFFSGVQYYTGQVFDMETITKAGHAVGAMVGFDLAHAAGNIDLKMHDWDVDFAVWCNYKYMNGGPGVTAGVYVHERFHQRTDLPRLAGWFGNKLETRFLMRPDFEVTPNAEGWMISNTPVLTSAALRASLDVFGEAGFAKLTQKSRQLTAYLSFLIEQINDPRIKIITPADARGAQLSIYVSENGRAIFDAVIAEGVVGDWREPNVIRVAPVPLYNTYSDVYRFSEILKETLARIA